MPHSHPPWRDCLQDRLDLELRLVFQTLVHIIAEVFQHVLMNQKLIVAAGGHNKENVEAHHAHAKSALSNSSI
jgi:uncharacterized protein (UPF0333 family)